MSPATKGPTRSLQFRDWSLGINRTAARTAIKDNQTYSCENFQPIGSGQLKSLQPPADPIATIAAGIASLWGISIKIAGTDVGRLISINLDGSIDAIDPTNGNVVSVAPAATVTPAARLTMWQDNPLLIGDPTTGYFSWDGTTLVHYAFTFTGTTHTTDIIDGIASTAGLAAGMLITAADIPPGTRILSVDSANQITLDAAATGSNAGETLTVGAGAPPSVTDLAVFEGRVWLVSASRTITFTAPNSYTDFSSVDAAGSTTITDSVFQGPIVRLLSALEVLWIVGDSAVNAISNVQVQGTPVLTTFSNTNIVANVGSVRPESVNSFFRTFLFFAPYGVYAIVGATPQKLSDDLDGLFPLLDTSLGRHNPSGVFALNEVFIWAVLVRFNDPVRGARPVLLCFAKNAWFMASQGNLDWITSLTDAQGNPQLWGSDGHNIYQCFAGTGPAYHLMKTKLWDFGQFFSVKQALRVACEFESDNPVQSLLSIDTGLTNSVETLDISGGNVFAWTGFGGAPFLWTGFGGAPFMWISGGLQLPRGPANASGYYLGMQLEGTSLPFTLSGLALEVDSLGEWSEVTP